MAFSKLREQELCEVNQNLELEFRELFERYYSSILNVAMARINDFGRAEEVTAHTFQLSWEKRSESKRSFSIVWLHTTLRKLLANEFRKNRSNRDKIEQMGQILLRTTALVNMESTIAENDQIASSIRTLAEDEREVIWLFYWADLSVKEIAGVLKISEGAVRVRIHRARQKLKPLLSQLENLPEDVSVRSEA